MSSNYFALFTAKADDSSQRDLDAWECIEEIK